MGFGKSILPQKINRPVQVLAGDNPEWLPIGQTIAWDLIPVNATSAIVELADGMQIVPGDAGVEYGTIFAKITEAGVYNGMWAPYNEGNLQAAPTVAPVGVQGGAGALGVGAYKLAYTYVNVFGETTVSPLATINIIANKQIDVSAIVFPTGVTSVKWYLSKAADSVDIAFLVTKNTGAAFSINALPGGGAAEEPGANTTTPEGLSTLRRDETAILNRSICKSNADSEHIGMLGGGICWGERLKVGGGGQPTLANLRAALPGLRLTPQQNSI